MNTGQFKTVLRDQYLVDAKPLNKISGQALRIAESKAGDRGNADLNGMRSTASGAEPYWKGVRRRVRTSFFLVCNLSCGNDARIRSIWHHAVNHICGNCGCHLWLCWPKRSISRSTRYLTLEQILWRIGCIAKRKSYLAALVRAGNHRLAAALVYLSVSELGIWDHSEQLCRDRARFCDRFHRQALPISTPLRTGAIGHEMNDMTTIGKTRVETTFKDWETDQEVRWCPGCGDYAILKAVQRTLADVGADPRTPRSSAASAARRASPIISRATASTRSMAARRRLATGVKLANPDLDVWIITGDGDALSIGGNHTMHVLRRNLDCQISLVQQRDLRPHQGPIFADQPRGHQIALDAVRIGRSSRQAGCLRARIGRPLRGARLRRLEEPDRCAQGRLCAQGRGVRGNLPELHRL